MQASKEESLLQKLTKNHLINAKSSKITLKYNIQENHLIKYFCLAKDTITLSVKLIIIK